jgi:TATA-binding protein-associated factor Taf7
VFPVKVGVIGGQNMSNRKKIVKLFHVRYVADFLVPALNAKEAFQTADEEMTAMVEGDELELDDIFEISIENDRFHIVETIEEVEEDDDDSDEDDDDSDEDDDDSEDEDEDDDDDDDEDGE